MPLQLNLESTFTFHTQVRAVNGPALNIRRMATSWTAWRLTRRTPACQMSSQNTSAHYLWISVSFLIWTCWLSRGANGHKLCNSACSWYWGWNQRDKVLICLLYIRENRIFFQHRIRPIQSTDTERFSPERGFICIYIYIRKGNEEK